MNLEEKVLKKKDERKQFHFAKWWKCHKCHYLQLLPEFRHFPSQECDCKQYEYPDEKNLSMF